MTAVDFFPQPGEIAYAEAARDGCLLDAGIYIDDRFPVQHYGELSTSPVVELEGDRIRIEINLSTADGMKEIYLWLDPSEAHNLAKQIQRLRAALT